MGIAEDLEIDKHSLDICCMNQPMLYQKYSDELAELSFQRDQLKEKLEVLKAEVDGEIRAEPEAYGLPSKPTETAIKSTLTCDKRVIEKTEEYLEKVKEVNILMGVKIALEHKKTSLELLVKLYTSGYWADPNIKEADKQVYEKKVVEKESLDELNSNPRLQKRRIKNG